MQQTCTGTICDRDVTTNLIISGGLSGVTTRATISPFDVVKIRLQLHVNTVIASFSIFTNYTFFKIITILNISATQDYYSIVQFILWYYHILVHYSIITILYSHRSKGELTKVCSTLCLLFAEKKGCKHFGLYFSNTNTLICWNLNQSSHSHILLPDNNNVVCKLIVLSNQVIIKTVG